MILTLRKSALISSLYLVSLAIPSESVAKDWVLSCDKVEKYHIMNAHIVRTSLIPGYNYAQFRKMRVLFYREEDLNGGRLLVELASIDGGVENENIHLAFAKSHANKLMVYWKRASGADGVASGLLKYNGVSFSEYCRN